MFWRAYVDRRRAFWNSRSYPNRICLKRTPVVTESIHERANRYRGVSRRQAAATLDATRRFRIFVGMLLVAFFFFAFAVFVGLPVLVLRPQKFALCFTMGSLSFMSSRETPSRIFRSKNAPSFHCCWDLLPPTG